jgi:SAM-dependent methyltransferase
MKDFTERTYGDRIAEVYDRWHGGQDPLTVSTLLELARGGPVLELGIGTGRVALPLQEKGVRVSGLDASEAMIAKLRSKPGGASLPVTIGDFADVNIEGKFSLVCVLFNTFFALLTQSDQVRCFANVARHLEPEGVFLIEAFVPDLARFRGRQDVRAIRVEQDDVALDVALVDPAQQLITCQHVVLTPDGIRFYPVRMRYAWPSELDLMARLAGLRLTNRWGGWDRSAFTGESTSHVSVYGLAT